MATDRSIQTTGLPFFGVFLLFIISYFLRLPARFPVLGLVRLDLILAGASILTVLLHHGLGEVSEGKPWRFLRLLLIYIAVTLPFVQWPGTVLKISLLIFIKGFAFFPLVASYLSDEARVRRFLIIFFACQYVRVLEPLYLHLTQGYWGEGAYVSASVRLDRLAGGPYDVIGANGLAYVIITVLCFFPTIYSFFRSSIVRAGLVASLPLLGYTLLLTGSRSGFLAGFIWLALFVASSRHKIALAIIGVVFAAGLIATLDPLQYDRFLSIFNSDTQSASTAEYRIEGLFDSLHVALQGPIFGYGLGTSLEAQYNVIGETHLAHNLFLEALQEVGFIGTFIFLAYLFSIYRLLFQRAIDLDATQHFVTDEGLTRGLRLWFLTSVFFAFFSYGLSSYEWYLIGGITMVLARKRDKVCEAIPAIGSIRR